MCPFADCLYRQFYGQLPASWPAPIGPSCTPRSLSIVEAREANASCCCSARESWQSDCADIVCAETVAPLVSRETLLQEVRGYNSGVTTHTLETHIYRLRQKMEEDVATPAILVTEAGGYKLVRPINHEIACLFLVCSRQKLVRFRQALSFEHSAY
jgi:Transcriptional regulatory protein, C terminal